MASKHAKLKLALTRAIIDFFLQEDLYADELKIQGTVCVTADRSAIFVTQITETVNEGFSQDAGPSSYTSDAPLNHYRPHEDSPEDLTCKSGVHRPETTPPVAHTKTHQHTAIHKNSPFGKPHLNLLHSPPPSGAQNKSEWLQQHSGVAGNYCGELAGRESGGQDLSAGGCTSFNATSLAPGRFPLLEKEDRANNQLLTLNSAILNAAAKSAIQRLTSLNRDREKSRAPGGEWSEGKDPAGNSLDHQRENSIQDKDNLLQEVIDCSSAKKRRIEKSTILQQPLEKSLVVNHSNMLESEMNSQLPHDCEEPLMLVTPKRERISDDECDPERDNDKSDLSATNAEGTAKLLPMTGLDLSPHSDSSRKQASPPGGGSSGSAPWTFTVATMKEEPGTLVTEWSSADWMRKPRTKFSQEQLQALEMEYKNDPFLSTSADKRAELARRLNITEKNVQIWFQNQRRRRRAAAYSQMHYTLTDAKTQAFTNNNGTEESGETTGGSPEPGSDHDDTVQYVHGTGEKDKDCKREVEPGREAGEEMGESRPGSVCSLADSSSSELVIATDESPQASGGGSPGKDTTEETSQETKQEEEEEGEEGQAEVVTEEKEKCDESQDATESSSPPAEKEEDEKS